MVFLFRYGINVMKVGYPLLRRPKCCGVRPYSQKVLDTENNRSSEFIPFMGMIHIRRAQAARSIVVQVQSSQSYKELYTYCNSIATVKEMLHYSEGPEQLHFIVVEFSTEEDVKKVLAESTHIQDYQNVPADSQFLWFRAASRKLSKLKQSKAATLLVEKGTNIIGDADLKTALNKCETVSDQMSQLYQLTKLNDIGQRLRFLTARQVERTISGLFPRACAYPFGSSVNGFGKMGCDLDLLLRLTDEKENINSRLIHHCKATSGSDRTTNQRNMEAIGDLINLFLPGCTQVRRILQARVPIIKYYQQLTNIECDLSMGSMSGVYMSEFLYLMGELDERVRPLIFTIRKWAKEMMLTNSSPGRWITNFSLTLMALAFLQKPLRSPPVLPTLNHLTKLAGPDDQYVTEDGINCTFLRDPTKLKFKVENNSSLEELLLEFFEFYSHFDFANKAICLNEAVSISKPEYSPLYIVNPLERGLNVSKNVSVEEIERLKIEFRNAAWLLESQENKSDDKGLISIFTIKPNIKYKIDFASPSKQNRLMEVKALFGEGENIDSINETKIDFKNKAVEKQVTNIKTKTRESIKTMEMRQAGRKSRR